MMSDYIIDNDTDKYWNWHSPNDKIKCFIFLIPFSLIISFVSSAIISSCASSPSNPVFFQAFPTQNLTVPSFHQCLHLPKRPRRSTPEAIRSIHFHHRSHCCLHLNFQRITRQQNFHLPETLLHWLRPMQSSLHPQRSLRNPCECLTGTWANLRFFLGHRKWCHDCQTSLWWFKFLWFGWSWSSWSFDNPS